MSHQFIVSGLMILLSTDQSAYPSCSGLKGCNPCYDSLIGVEKSDVKCDTKEECIAVPHRCGDFYYLNKNHSEKFIDKNLKTGPKSKAPELNCEFHEAWRARICQPKK